MESLFDETVNVELVAARGWMSPYEASSLKPGDLVLSAGTAGLEAELSLNGEYLASARAFVFSGYFAASLSGFSPPRATAFVPERGTALPGLLPFQIAAARMEARLSDLSGAGPGSALRFDTPFRQPSQVEIRSFGMLLARGHMAVKGELLGVLVTETPRPAFSASEPLLTGALSAQGRESGFKLYDFSRPDAVTSMVIKAMRELHGRFLESLKERYPAMYGYALSYVDQLNASEWRDYARAGGRALTIAQAGRRAREYGIDRAEAIEARVIEGPRHPAPLSIQERSGLESWLSAKRSLSSEGPVALYLPEGIGFGAEAFLACLRSCWNRAADCVFRDPRQEGSLAIGAGGPRSFEEFEMVLCVRFEKGGAEPIDLCYSLRSLGEQLETLDRYGRAHA